MARFELSKMSIDKTCIEVEDSPTDENNEPTDEKDEEESKPARISKAQKRREKKENAERERNQRIIEQEALNIHGKRNVETQAIKNILVEKDLMIYEIPSDGHWYCYNSFPKKKLQSNI